MLIIYSISTITPLMNHEDWSISMCSSNTYWQYSHCIWQRRRDMVLFFFHSWTLEVSRSEQWGGPGSDDMKGGSWTQVTGVFSVMALGHRYSESSCNAEAWPVLACRAATWEAAHSPADTQPAGSPGGRFRLQITDAPLWPFWPRSTNTNKSGSIQRDKDRFNIRHHGSC